MHFSFFSYFFLSTYSYNRYSLFLVDIEPTNILNIFLLIGQTLIIPLYLTKYSKTEKSLMMQRLFCFYDLRVISIPTNLVQN